MDEFAEMESLGLAILRKEGINFTVFKSMLLPLFYIKVPIREDSMVRFYNSYAWCRGKFIGESETVERWAILFFQDFTLAEHGFELKVKI